jgi:hypothetical protein
MHFLLLAQLLRRIKNTKMRTIPSPDIDPEQAFENIIGRKNLVNRNLLNELKEIVFEAYGDYSANLNTLRPFFFEDNAIEALLKCYTSNTLALKDLRDTILNLAGSVCPYCGVDRPKTLDHFLPKECFPEFSVYSLNLIACCGSCNLAKDEDYTQNGRRFFLHMYLDRIPNNMNCLRARVLWESGEPTFEFFLEPNCANFFPALFNILQEHVFRLELLSAYSEIAGEEFSDKDDWIIEGDTPEEIRERIQINIQRKRVRYGPLYWKVALWEAVLADDNAINYLIPQY